MLEEKLKEYIENEIDDDDLLSLCKEINNYNGMFDFVECWDFEELAETMTAYEFGRAIVYGIVTNVSDLVRFNGYGNLENVMECDIIEECRDNIDEIVYQIIDLYGVIYLPCEIEEIIQEFENEED